MGLVAVLVLAAWRLSAEAIALRKSLLQKSL
jgi:hypothetical protein